MPRLFNALPLIAALTIGTALQAQETATPDAEADSTTQVETSEAATPEQPATEGETAAEDTSGATELDMGQEVVEDPTYIKETYGDWQLKCFRSEGQEDLCQMYQLLKEDAGNPVAEFSIFKLPENGQAEAGATIVVPLGTLLTKELLISVDGGKAKSFAYSFCSMVGCFARVGLTSADLDAFKRGATANLQIVPAQAPDQTVNIKASLSGFTAAYDNVSTVRN